MIRVSNVSKRYGPLLAVDAVSFDIGAGEIVGFLGPNGAGKSTLLKMLSTYIAPTTGTVQIAGHDTQREALSARRAVGYLSEHNALYETMRVGRFLEFAGKAHGITGKALKERFAWVVDRCELETVLTKRIHECSKGFRQRIGLATALIHDPPVLLLDEPTHGLDPLQVVAFRDLLREIQKDRAILFSSHILSEVLEISERILVIQSGKLLLDDSVSNLQAEGDVQAHILELVRGENS